MKGEVPTDDVEKSLNQQTRSEETNSELNLLTFPSLNFEGNMASENLNVPITLLKEAGQCTKHPIIKFVAYSRPSPKLRAFVHNLEEELQTNVYETSKKLERNEATQEELRVFQKSETWEIVDLLTGKISIAFECVFIKKYSTVGG